MSSWNMLSSLQSGAGPRAIAATAAAATAVAATVVATVAVVVATVAVVATLQWERRKFTPPTAFAQPRRLPRWGRCLTDPAPKPPPPS